MDPQAAAADAQVVSNESPEAKEETEATSETTKVEEIIEKPADKTPETPVTEPITNGSNASESPKEEVPQVVEERAVVEAKEEVAAPVETSKSIEHPEAPIVETLPINGLKIEDTVNEVKEVVENKVDISDKIIMEPVEAKLPETVETEVCDKKELPEPAETVEAPPPLPVNPPPSSLTIFAEKTMAPHLVDTQVVGEMPIVDVEASLPSDLPSPPVTDVTDNSQQAIVNESQSIANVTIEEQTVEKSKPNEIISNETINPSEIIIQGVNKVEPAEIVESKIVENLAVVSSSEPEPTTVSPILPDPKETIPIELESKESTIFVESEPKEIVPLAEISQDALKRPSGMEELKDNVSKIDDLVVESQENISLIKSSIPAEEVNVESVVIPEELSTDILKSEVVSEQIAEETANLQIVQCENIDIVPQVSDDSISPPPPEAQSVPSESSQSEELPKELPLELIQSDNLEMSLSDIIPPPVNIPESPLPQRTPSDPDVSETGLTEQSDSFPAPPPPVSCPESITEISASESLPPPPSDGSQPDTVLNSPTSEISDFPPKDLPSPVNHEQHAEAKDIKPEAVNSELPTAETQAPVPEEMTPIKVAESSVEEVPKVIPANASQVKDIAEITTVDMQTDSIPTQNCVVAAE